MNHLSLFAGAGMLDLALEQLGHRTTATAEIDPFCRQILAARFPNAQHLADVKDVKLAALRESVDLVTGGFPCQDVSDAGTGLGLSGERSGLWSEFARVLDEVRPRYALIENVPRLRRLGLHVILCDLYRMGYDARWDCIPAASVGAPHMRDRIWIGCTHKSSERLPLIRTSHVIAWTRADSIVNNRGESVTSFPRAGSMTNGVVLAQTPRHPQKGLRPRKLGTVGNREWWPTPTRADGAGGPGTSPKRTGGMNLRTAVDMVEGNGRLNPEWVEWLMGLPFGWTNPNLPNTYIGVHQGWRPAPIVERTAARQQPNRGKRIRVLGNGLVPHAAKEAMSYLLPGAIHESDTSQASASA